MVVNVFDDVKLVAVEHRFKLLLCLLAEHLDDHFHLLDFVVARENRFAEEQLSEDAPCCPHVYRSRVFLPGDHDFGSAVPPSRDVVGENRGGTLSMDIVVGNLCTCEAKIADL